MSKDSFLSPSFMMLWRLSVLLFSHLFGRLPRPAPVLTGFNIQVFIAPNNDRFLPLVSSSHIMKAFGKERFISPYIESNILPSSSSTKPKVLRPLCSVPRKVVQIFVATEVQTPIWWSFFFMIPLTWMLCFLGAVPTKIKVFCSK